LAIGPLSAYKICVWTTDDIRIEIEEAEGRTVIVRAHTPVGTVEVIAELELVGGKLWARKAHVQGLRSGALSRSGLNALARKFLEEAGADRLVVEGGTRTTGARPGRRPAAFRFPS
jgi:hypothetical protein